MHTPRKRPISVTVTVAGVVLLGTVNVWRAIALYNQIPLLDTLETTLDPRIRMVASIGWATGFFIAAGATWKYRPNTRWIIPALLALYAAYQLLQPFVFAPYALTRPTPLDLATYTIAILFAGWALNRPASRALFASNPTTGATTHGQT